jgi:hypothetical protein
MVPVAGARKDALISPEAAEPHDWRLPIPCLSGNGNLDLTDPNDPQPAEILTRSILIPLYVTEQSRSFIREEQFPCSHTVESYLCLPCWAP